MIGPGSATRTAVVVGTGLVGGSIGLALRERGWRVIGSDIDATRLGEALAIGAIGEVDSPGHAGLTWPTPEAGDLPSESVDLVFICTPVGEVAGQVRRARIRYGPAAVITDVAGVKQSVVEAIDDPGFVGGHPMAGSELDGLAGADAALFEGATWVLTPVATTDQEAWARVASVVSSLGARVLALDPAHHDRLVAQISHVPHLLAVTVMNLATEDGQSEAALLDLAAGGFRDMTRVAAGHPAIWPDVCLQNSAAILACLDRLGTRLSGVGNLIGSGDRVGLSHLLVAASQARRSLPGGTGGSGSTAEIRMPITDRPGMVADVTTRLGAAGINIANLEIVHSREGGRGVLVLLVDSADDTEARAALAPKTDPALRPARDTESESLLDGGAAVPQGGRLRTETGSDSLALAGGLPLVGQVSAPGDKSISHRALILGALADGASTIGGLSAGADVLHTMAAIEALGAQVHWLHPPAPSPAVRPACGSPSFTRLLIQGNGGFLEPDDILDLGNSGTSLRLLAGACAGVSGATFTFTGDASLRSRPMDRVAVPLGLMGARVIGRSARVLAPLTVNGAVLSGIRYETPVPSAQVKSALLLAGLSARGETVVTESHRSRSHTEEMLVAAGADLEVGVAASGGHCVRVRPSVLKPTDVVVPADPSSAAFWVVAGLVVAGSELTVGPFYRGPARAGFLAVLARMGAALEDLPDGALHVRHCQLTSTSIGVEEIPGVIDEIPVLAVAAAFATGTTVISGAAELRVKESDRIATMVAGLSAMGVEVRALADGMAVVGSGGPSLRGCRVDSHGDHRVAMALAVAAMAGRETTVIDGWQCVSTSYPGFAQEMTRLQGARPGSASDPESESIRGAP
ncbi:MAG: 3-phosphoshikimate 1-carboxyvinyltransferase [Acidimicrobiales bacterium]